MIQEPDFRKEPFLTYYSHGFKFEFIGDELFITDFGWKRKYRVQFSRDKETPFTIITEEK